MVFLNFLRKAIHIDSLVVDFTLCVTQGFSTKLEKFICGSHQQSAELSAECKSSVDEEICEM